MRRKFFELLYSLMEKNPDVWLLVGDLGYGGADKIRDKFPDRFINCGAAEFSMVGIAVGLALEGKIPICYTITPFYFRAFEMIRNYVDHELTPVILVGAGRDHDYLTDGYSHYAGDDSTLLAFKNMTCKWPETEVDMEDTFNKAIRERKPIYINLKRE